MLDRVDGQWSTGIGPCPRCAMRFAACAVVALDTTGTFLGYRPMNEDIHLPRGLNRVACPFCGIEFAIETPAVFYVPERFAVIYCLPTSAQVTSEDALDHHRRDIESIRNRYAATLDPTEQARYWAAPELFTYTWEKFLDAVQRGETLMEDHVFNMAIFRDGTGVISDLTKKFVRDLTKAEVGEHLVRYGHDNDVTIVDGCPQVDLERLYREVDAKKAYWEAALRDADELNS
jgi:hypothetical protein